MNYIPRAVAVALKMWKTAAWSDQVRKRLLPEKSQWSDNTDFSRLNRRHCGSKETGELRTTRSVCCLRRESKWIDEYHAMMLLGDAT